MQSQSASSGLEPRQEEKNLEEKRDSKRAIQDFGFLCRLWDGQQIKFN